MCFIFCHHLQLGEIPVNMLSLTPCFPTEPLWGWRDSVKDFININNKPSWLPFSPFLLHKRWSGAPEEDPELRSGKSQVCSPVECSPLGLCHAKEPARKLICRGWCPCSPWIYFFKALPMWAIINLYQTLQHLFIKVFYHRKVLWWKHAFGGLLEAEVWKISRTPGLRFWLNLPDGEDTAFETGLYLAALNHNLLERVNLLKVMFWRLCNGSDQRRVSPQILSLMVPAANVQGKTMASPSWFLLCSFQLLAICSWRTSWARGHLHILVCN